MNEQKLHDLLKRTNLIRYSYFGQYTGKKHWSISEIEDGYDRAKWYDKITSEFINEDVYFYHFAKNEYTLLGWVKSGKVGIKRVK